MFWEGAGILLHHARKVREPSINVVTFDYGRPKLILSFVHGEVSGELTGLPGAVLATIEPEPRAALLLLRLHGELEATDAEV